MGPHALPRSLAVAALAGLSACHLLAGSDEFVDAPPCDEVACRCEDGERNGDETDVDCGGDCLPDHPCDAGARCAGADDCASGNCCPCEGDLGVCAVAGCAGVCESAGSAT